MGDEHARTHHRRVSDVLGAALERPESEREAFAREACADEPAVLADVLSLLAETGAEESGGSSFMDVDGAIRDARRAAAETLDRSGVHAIAIPGYRMIRPLGSGGMGRVFEAEQVSPRRRVAVKIVQELGGREALRRFRIESEVLGRLRHPCIAQVYEAGTYRDGGGAERPFFAMEFVESASPITTHAEQQELDRRARVELFVRVCGAVQFGHQRGIIHRDLKPGNILVDSAGDPKVIDYGVARVAEGASLAGSQTGAGSVIGTVRYMSPEQCSGDPGAADARSDVYALGVVLYELLTGRMPYELEHATLASAARVIAEREPSRPGSVDRSLRGDLEAVLLKALEKDPERRYASAAALGADLERWLGNRPVEARSAGAVYQLRKLAGRHRAAAAFAVGSVLVLVGATAFSATMAVRAGRAAERERRSADSERERREEMEDLSAYLAGIMTSVTPESTRSSEVTVREMLADAEARIDDELRDRPLVAARVLHEIGAARHAVGDAAGAENALRRSLETRERLLGDDGATLATLVRLGDAALDLGRYAEAVALFERAHGMADRLGDATGPLAVEAMSGIGVASAELGDLDRAEQTLRAAIEAVPGAGISEAQRLTLMNMLGMLRSRAGATEDALVILRDVADGRRALLGADHPATLTAENNHGSTLTEAGRYADAEGVLRGTLASRRRVLGDDHPDTLSTMNNLAIALSRQEKTEEAGGLTRAVHAARVATLGPTHPDTITAAMNLYTHLDRVDEDEEADRLLAEYVPIAEATLEPEQPLRLFVVSKAVLSGLRNEAYRDAADAAGRAVSALEGSGRGDGWQAARFRAMRGAALSLDGDRGEGGRLLRAGLEGLRGTRGPEHPWTRWAAAQLESHEARGEEPVP